MTCRSAAVRDKTSTSWKSCSPAWRPRPDAAGAAEAIRRIRRELDRPEAQEVREPDAWETVLVARHPDRPQTLDYIELIFDEFVELHGDRAFGDDRAIRTGFARLGDFKVLLVGHQKGHTLKERSSASTAAPTPRATARR